MNLAINMAGVVVLSAGVIALATPCLRTVRTPLRLVGWGALLSLVGLILIRI